jgi:hypothetical protein
MLKSIGNNDTILDKEGFIASILSLKHSENTPTVSDFLEDILRIESI